MAIPALASTRSFSAPPAFLAGNGNASANAVANPSQAGSKTDQVSLSPRAQALQQADVAQESALLGKLTRASLANFIPNADKAQISFDQLTYSDQRSVSFAQSGNASVLQSEQQTSLSGTGRITTADGQVFEFSAELEVSQQTSIAQGGDFGNFSNFGDLGGLNGLNGLNNLTNGPASPPRQVGPGRNTGIIPPDLADNTIARQLPGLKELEEASDRLLDLLQQLGPQSAANSEIRDINEIGDLGGLGDLAGNRNTRLLAA